MHDRRPIMSPFARGYRLALLFATSTTMSACVIPVAPQFDDPEQNFPPFVVTSDPGVGEIFTPGQDETGMATRVIVVTLGDQNLNDPLYLRWLLDYPSTDPDGGQLLIVAQLPPSGRPDRSPARFVPTCPIRGTNTHRLVLSGSHRPLLGLGNGESGPPGAPRGPCRPGAHRV